MNYTKKTGLTTELQCQLYFTELGYNVSIPLCEDCKYDMIVDFNGILKKVQVKTCRETKNGIEISTRSIQRNSKEFQSITYCPNDVDYFATFYNSELYLIRCLEPTTDITLSFNKSQLNNNPVRYLPEFEAKKQIDKILNGNEDVIKRFMIYQYDLNMNLLNTFSTARDAARFLGNENKNSHISKAINNKCSAYGYIWERRLVDVI